MSSVKPKKRKKGKKEKGTEDMNRTFRNASPKKQQTQGTGSVSPLGKCKINKNDMSLW